MEELEEYIWHIMFKNNKNDIETISGGGILTDHKLRNWF